MFAKGVTEIILQVLRQIGCTFDSSLVDAIMGGIEGFVEAFVDNMLNSLAQKAIDFLNFAENCINQIFGSIFLPSVHFLQSQPRIRSSLDFLQLIERIESWEENKGLLHLEPEKQCSLFSLYSMLLRWNLERNLVLPRLF